MAFCYCLAATAGGQLPPVTAATDYAHLNPSMTPPLLVHSIDPAYTQEALKAQIQGTVVLQTVIGVNGQITHASVLSPLPGGLDQKALQAVQAWRYQPATMDGVMIPVLSTVDVLFRLPYQPNRAPAGPMPPDFLNAAKLGEQYENQGKTSEARRSFRLCAAAADAYCEYRLGKLLVTGPDVNPNDFTQGVAWLELSKAHGNESAAKLQAIAAAKLSSIQLDWVAQVKPHLEQKLR